MDHYNFIRAGAEGEGEVYGFAQVELFYIAADIGVVDAFLGIVNVVYSEKDYRNV